MKKIQILNKIKIIICMMTKKISIKKLHFPLNIVYNMSYNANKIYNLKMINSVFLFNIFKLFI